MLKYSFLAQECDIHKRVDLFLKTHLEKFSRSQIQRWIKGGSVCCNGVGISCATLLKAGDEVSLVIPKEEIRLLPENIPLDIIYEDKAILVLNKSPGIVTHPGSGNKKGTLANAVAYHLKNLKSSFSLEEGNLRLGIVHRLDKETSGVMVVAKNNLALNKLTQAFQERSVDKVYRAIVLGSVELDVGEIEGSIDRAYRSTRMEISPTGRYARTDFKVLRRFQGYSYLEVAPKTGRTHQIRLHLSKIGFPILGDKTYGPSETTILRQMLHAHSLTFSHPTTQKLVTFRAPLPKDFKEVLKSLASKAE